MSLYIYIKPSLLQCGHMFLLHPMMTTLWMKYVVSRNKYRKVLTEVRVIADLNTLNITQTCTSYSICNIYIILSCHLEAHIYRQYLIYFMELHTFSYEANCALVNGSVHVWLIHLSEFAINVHGTLSLCFHNVLYPSALLPGYKWNSQKCPKTLNSESSEKQNGS
jgi:hypothetical protein